MNLGRISLMMGLRIVPVALAGLIWSAASAQVLRYVSFDVTSTNAVAIRYYLEPSSEELRFEVSVFVSDDNGRSFFPPRSVRGDVGVVSGTGWKSAEWLVLDDVDAFEGERCVVKIVGKEMKSSGEILAEAIWGSSETRARADGIFVYGGAQKIEFLDRNFKDALSQGVIQPKIGYEVGLRYVSLPLVLEADFFSQKYNLGGLVASPGTQVNHAGINFHGALAPFSAWGYFVPFIGAGYQTSALFVGEDYGEKATNQLAVNTALWSAGLDIILSASLRIGIEYRRSLFAGTRTWQQFMLLLAIGR